MKVRPKNSFLLAKAMPNAEFIVFAGAGHGINMECADEFHDAIKRNFNRSEGGKSPSEGRERVSLEKALL